MPKLDEFIAENDIDEGTKEGEPSTSKNKILPLGASRVEGARPDFESYRYELWKLLEEGGWESICHCTVLSETIDCTARNHS